MESIDYEIICVKNRIFPSNTYFLRNINNLDCIIIDPGLDTESIANKINELELLPKAIFCTHGHFDHIGSVAFIKNKFKVPFYLHENDFNISQSANFYLKISKINHKIVTCPPDILLKGENQTVCINNFEIESQLFPGHTNGSCIFKLKNNLFTGDLIYKKGLGFNSFPGENKIILKESIQKIFKNYINSSIVYPGHGESSNLNEIMNINSELKKFLSL